MTATVLDRPAQRDRTGIVTDTQWAAIVAQLTRREFIGAGALTAATLAGLATDAQAATATRKVRTPQGTYTVPAHPHRVVCIDYYSGIFLTELGLKPAGGIDYSFVNGVTMYPPYVAKLKAIPTVGTITDIDVEKVADLHPDLVIGPTPHSLYDNSPGAIEKLGAIVDIATIDFGKTGDWRPPYLQAAEEVNLVAEHNRLRAQYQAALGRVRAAHAKSIARTTIASLDYAQGGNFSVDLPTSSAGIVYSDLGLTFVAPARGTNSNGVNLSFDRLDELSGASMIVYRADQKGVPQNGLEAVFKLPEWKQLPAVKAGNVFPVTWLDVCGYRWAQEAATQLGTLLGRLKPGA